MREIYSEEDILKTKDKTLNMFCYLREDNGHITLENQEYPYDKLELVSSVNNTCSECFYSRTLSVCPRHITTNQLLCSDKKVFKFIPNDDEKYLT